MIQTAAIGSRAALALPLVWASTLLGCAPSVRPLLKARHYDEALCAGSELAYFDDNDEYNDNIAKDVVRSITADLNPSVHLQVVTGAERSTMLGAELATKLDARQLFVRVLNR